MRFEEFVGRALAVAVALYCLGCLAGVMLACVWLVWRMFQ